MKRSRNGGNGGSPRVVTFSRTDPGRLRQWWDRQLLLRFNEEVASEIRRREIEEFKRSLK